MAASELESKWISAGGSALALATVATDSYEADVDDDMEFLSKQMTVFGTMDRVDLAMSNSWLSRMLVQSLVQQHGSIEAARQMIRDMAMALVEVEVELEQEPLA